MPPDTPHASHGGSLTRARRIVARLALLLGCAPLFALSPPHRGSAVSSSASSSSSAYDKALRLHEALEGRPQQQRTRRDYDRVLEAFRAVYHDEPRSTHADASVAAAAELLAEQGRIFEMPRYSQEAIGQYELLRRVYPASRYRYSALLTEGEIYSRDLDDRAAARTIFEQFLKLYPRNALAEEARAGLKKLHTEDHTSGPARMASSPAPTTPSSHGSSHHNAVLDAALASRAAPPAASRLHASGPSPSVQPAPSQPAQLAHTPAPSPVSPGGAARPSTTGTLVERDLPSEPGTNPSSDRGGDQSASQPDLPAVRARQEPSPHTTLSEAALNATPPPRRGRLPLVTGVRHWSTAVYTRVAIDLDAEVQYEASRVPNPDRIFFDLHGARLSPELVGKAVTVTDGGYLKRVRMAQSSNDVVRVVLDVSDVSEFSAFFLPNPSRLIIDIHGKAPIERAAASAFPATRVPAPTGQRSASTATPDANSSAAPQQAASPSARNPFLPSRQAAPPAPATAGTATDAQPRAPVVIRRIPPAADTLGDIATLDRQPNTIRATRSPTTAPIAASVANTIPAPQSSTMADAAPTPRHTRVGSTNAQARNLTPADASAPAIHAAAPTATGERSMVRALGLKIGRIVVDAGHGGHDSGTLGPGGIEEKDVVLDVALRLGRLLKQRLGADVIYTRDDDTFIPLETRTAIANKAQADLFISVHANSSQDASARGVETYYLNFTSSADALEVAARENAVSDQSIHQLSDLVKKITLQDKIAESREFAGDVEQSLYTGLEAGNPGLKDRGVKKAPFVVLIGANMPSILAEISFLTNPDDAHQLRDGEYRQRIAESLYRGVAKYVGSLSGVRLADNSARPAGQ